jgi:hypothetical protein
LPLIWFAANALASDKPYQLCDFGLSPKHTIDTNYRYPPAQAKREPTDWDELACDGPLEQQFGHAHGCGWWYTGNCGYRDQIRDVCGDGSGWWGELAVLRQAWWIEAAPGSAATETWRANPVVEIRRLSRNYRGDHYRGWFWEWPDQKFDFLGTVEGTIALGNYPRCHTMAYLVGFFNGVWNTRREAERSLEVMKKQDLVGLDWRGAPIRYELFYNQSCKRNDGGTCLQDVAEMFRQRSAEIDGLLGRRWEYFWEQVTGQHAQAGSFTQRLRARVVRSDHALAQWFDALYNATLAKITALTAQLAENPPTAQDAAAHTTQLIRAGQRAERAVLVAHSQGNLFANAAYDAFLTHSRRAGAAVGEDTGYVAAQVVHIAPASPTLRGPYVLASGDLVINGLRRVDGTYLPVSNAPLPVDGKDPSGHKLLDTYLDEARPLRAQIRQLVTNALDAL